MMTVDRTPLRAGAAQVEITPQLGTHLSGSVGQFRPAAEILDPTYARAIVLERDGRRTCILTLDTTFVTREYSARIRQAAAGMGFSPDAVMVHSLQHHSTPSIGHFMLDEDFEGVPQECQWLRGSDAEYNEFATARAIEAIRRAVASLGPASVGAGSGIEGRMAFNRRAVQQDGTVFMPLGGWKPPLGPVQIRYIEGPTDPEVGVVCLRDQSGLVLATMLHYTCHPVHVFRRPIPTVSADWPGAWASAMGRRCGEECVSCVLNGACGNINPWNPFDHDDPNDHVLMGDTLADTADRVISLIDFQDDAVLDWETLRLQIPVRELPEDQLERSRRVLEEHPEPVWTDDTRTLTEWQWMEAAQLMSVHLFQRREPVLDYEVQVLRIGDVAIVGLPGEPFVEGQLRIKMASPARLTYVAHAVNQYVGYIGTKEAFARGGHEVNTTYWSKLVPEALDMIVDGAHRCLTRVFGR